MIFRNRYKKVLIFASAAISLANICCQKASVPITGVVSIHASSATVAADGASLDTIYADLPVNALSAYRALTFQATSGLFANGSDTMTVYANRTDIDPGDITAVVSFQASLRTGPDTVLVYTATVPKVTDLLILNLQASVADSIQLVPSSYTLKDTFGMQVTVMGLLYNAVMGKVSQGAFVQFTDLNDLGLPAGGYFMPKVAIVDSSKVSAVYFPPLLPAGASIGSIITIKGSVLGANGAPTGASSTTSIYISP